ncbi:cuticle protein 21-like [Penaeus indicus]|uniref:cuticle protein 21-like n=1 Tax=Penaeus indicus TaxID=29960 RepID=UPI00300C8B61
MQVPVLLSLLAVAAALPQYGYAPTPYRLTPSYHVNVPARYNFDWAVRDGFFGNDYGHQETRDGYNTQGSYYVQLPDGRLQEVTYTVNGDSGFVANVNYKGQAQYPQPAYRPTSSYHPAPTYG